MCAMKIGKEIHNTVLCKISLSENGSMPEWVELIPSGHEINAIDGRKFKNTNPDKIIEAFKSYGLAVPIDYEHSTEIKAPKGEESPAAGWITELQNRDGSIWGKVEWTSKGINSLTNKEYKYISPAFILNKAKEIVEIVSAGLTNKPALTQLTALATQDIDKEEKMDKNLLLELGLAETASVDDCINAIKSLKTKTDELKTEITRANSDLSKFVPRADYDVVVARADKAEKEISDQKAEVLKKEIDTEINQALKDGKITPATADYHRSLCSQEGGLAKFKDFVKVAPVIAQDLNIGDKKVNNDPRLTDEVLEVARVCGISKETILASLKS
jgi:phage I-like protein